MELEFVLRGRRRGLELILVVVNVEAIATTTILRVVAIAKHVAAAGSSSSTVGDGVTTD